MTAAPTHALVVNLDYRTYSGLGQPRRDEFAKPVRRALVGPGPLDAFDPDMTGMTSHVVTCGGNRRVVSI